MIETRLVPKKLGFFERLRRSATLEGGLIGGLVMLWAMVGLVVIPFILLWIIVLVIAALLLFVALDSSVAGVQSMFSMLMLLATAGIATATGGAASLSIGLVAAASTAFITMELFRLHDLRRRGALVNSSLLAATLPWTGAVVFVSVCLSVVIIGPTSTNSVPWIVMPMAGFALLLGVLGLGLGAMADKSRRSGGRFDATIRTPPAPRQVDPLVAEARTASHANTGPMPPPPTGEPTGRRPTR